MHNIGWSSKQMDSVYSTVHMQRTVYMCTLYINFAVQRAWRKECTSCEIVGVQKNTAQPSGCGRYINSRPDGDEMNAEREQLETDSRSSAQERRASAIAAKKLLSKRLLPPTKTCRVPSHSSAALYRCLAFASWRKSIWLKWIESWRIAPSWPRWSSRCSIWTTPHTARPVQSRRTACSTLRPNLRWCRKSPRTSRSACLCPVRNTSLKSWEDKVRLVACRLCTVH